tara:strand:+ start:1284 stop:2120 length:837 start_codon:yes stop_codon:yes gene_type:complete
MKILNLKALGAAVLGLSMLFALPGCVDEGGTSSLSGGKADCPDCDPSGPSAFIQAGLSSRFYATGDTFYVGWRYFDRNDMDKSLRLADERVTMSDFYLFKYEVVSVDERIIDRTRRQVATIRISQAFPSQTAGFASVSSLFANHALTRHQYRLTFEMDDLLRPISETLYSKQFPNGRTVQTDIDSSLNGNSDIFPRTIPRIYRSEGSDTMLQLPDELHQLTKTFFPSYEEQTVRQFKFKDNGDLVYWRDGDLWPFFTRTRQGEGVLLLQKLVGNSAGQ